MRVKRVWKLLGAFLVLSSVPSLTYAQGAYVPARSVNSNVNGVLRPVAGATITVCAAGNANVPCAPPLAGVLFKDQALTQPLANPTTTDLNGNYPTMALAAGNYTITETAVGFTGFSYQITVTCGTGGCTATTLTVSGAATLPNICVSNGFYFAATPTCYPTLQNAFDAACALNPVGTVTIPPGTYTGPIASHYCSNLRIMGLSPGESRPAVGNLGVTPLTATTPVTLTYSATLNLIGIQNMRMENVMLDFGSCAGCSFTLTSSSFNQFVYVTLNNVGDTAAGQAALLITVSNGTSAALGSVWNSFDHLRINCNGAASHYCYAAVELLGAGSVNVAPAAFATLNSFWDLGVTGQIKYCIDAELNSDTNYFWHVNCNNDANPVPTNSAILAFNLNTPASDQDADGGVYDGIIAAGTGASSFIRAGQSNGNLIRMSQGSAGQPSVTVTGGTPTYSIQNIGLPGVTADLYVGGRISAVGGMGANSPGVAGDIMAERNATTGVFYLGSDGGNINRVGTQLLLDGTHIAGLGLTEQGANPCSTGVDLIFGNAGTHQLDLCNNSTSFFPVPQILATSFTTTAATTDNVTVTGMTSTGHCYLTATNSGAAGGIASVFISAKTTNQITVTHTATSGWTFDVVCSPQ